MLMAVFLCLSSSLFNSDLPFRSVPLFTSPSACLDTPTGPREALALAHFHIAPDECLPSPCPFTLAAFFPNSPPSLSFPDPRHIFSQLQYIVSKP